MKIVFILALCLWSSNVWAADVTANKILKRGTIIADHNVRIRMSHGEDIATVRTTYLGKQLTRTVYADHKIELQYLSAPVLVKRNAQVSMVYTFGVMQLSAKGRALQAGAKGETINVMNVSSRKKVMAVILASNLVEVGQ